MNINHKKKLAFLIERYSKRGESIVYGISVQEELLEVQALKPKLTKCDRPVRVLEMRIELIQMNKMHKCIKKYITTMELGQLRRGFKYKCEHGI